MTSLRHLLLIAFWAFVPALSAQVPTWDRFVRFQALADSLQVRWPSVVVVGDTIVVAANLFPADTANFSRRNTFTIVRSRGGPLPIPSGAFTFAHPQIASDGRGNLHMVWGEPRDTTASFASWLAAPASLWHSVLRNGRWSQPRKLLTGSFLSWGSDGRQLVCDSSGRLHVVLPGSIPGALAIVYLRVGASGELEDEVHWPGGSYATITSIGADSLIVAYATADSLTPRGGSAMFTRFSANGGRGWDPPALVTRSAQRNISPVVVERSKTDLHALWVEGGSKGGEVRAYTKASLSSTWKEVSTKLSLPGVLFRVTSARAKCGDYAVLMEYAASLSFDARLQILAVRVRDGRIVGSEIFPRLQAAVNVGIAPDGNSLRIVFSAANPGDETTMSVTATGRVCAAT